MEPREEIGSKHAVLQALFQGVASVLEGFLFCVSPRCFTWGHVTRRILSIHICLYNIRDTSFMAAIVIDIEHCSPFLTWVLVFFVAPCLFLLSSAYFSLLSFSLTQTHKSLTHSSGRCSVAFAANLALWALRCLYRVWDIVLRSRVDSASLRGFGSRDLFFCCLYIFISFHFALFYFFPLCDFNLETQNSHGERPGVASGQWQDWYGLFVWGVVSTHHCVLQACGPL